MRVGSSTFTILFWSRVPQSIHDYAAPLITINLPLTNFFLCASATYANIVRICRNTTKATDRLARADYLLPGILSHTEFICTSHIYPSMAGFSMPLPISGGISITP